MDVTGTAISTKVVQTMLQRRMTGSLLITTLTSTMCTALQMSSSSREGCKGPHHGRSPQARSVRDQHVREGGPRDTYRRGGVGLNSSFHLYGQNLGWHALRFVRGASFHSIHHRNRGTCSRWSDWLSYKILTRDDGLWLSDGMDRPPLCVKVNVLEKGKEGLVLTGNRDKLMSLVGIDSRTGRKLISSSRSE